MSIKVRPDQYPEIINTYNTDGKKAAYRLIKTQYGLKNPTTLMNRLKNDELFGYNATTDQFEYKGTNEDEIFLNIAELCENRADVPKEHEKLNHQTERVKAMEGMVHALISDRLLELSKYVLLDPIDKRILIDTNSMKTDGYQVIIN